MWKWKGRVLWGIFVSDCLATGICNQMTKIPFTPKPHRPKYSWFGKNRLKPSRKIWTSQKAFIFSQRPNEEFRERERESERSPWEESPFSRPLRPQSSHEPSPPLKAEPLPRPPFTAAFFRWRCTEVAPERDFPMLAGGVLSSVPLLGLVGIRLLVSLELWSRSLPFLRHSLRKSTLRNHLRLSSSPRMSFFISTRLALFATKWKVIL